MKTFLFRFFVALLYLGIFAFVRYFSGFEWAVLTSISIVMAELVTYTNRDPVSIKLHINHNGEEVEEEGNGSRSE